MKQRDRDALCQFLNGLKGYVVLRNQDVFNHLAEGGDLDLLVTDLPSAVQILYKYLGHPVRDYRRPHVCSFCYAWGKVDLFPALEWFGATYMSPNLVLSQAQVSDLGLSKPRLAHEAFIAWMYPLLWSKTFKPRYRDLILHAAQHDGEAFQQALHYAVGTRVGSWLWNLVLQGKFEVSVRHSQFIRLSVWLQSFLRMPRETIQGCITLLAKALPERIIPPQYRVVVSGDLAKKQMDIVNEIVSSFPPFVSTVRMYRWRPITNGSNKAKGGVLEKIKHSQVGSVVWLGYLFIHWIVGYWHKLARCRQRGMVLLFDSHYIDIVLHPDKFQYTGPLSVAKWVMKMMPKPNLIIMVQQQTDMLRSKRQQEEKSDTLLKHYSGLSAISAGFQILDATQTMEDSVDDVRNLILQHMSQHGEHPLKIQGSI